MHFDGVNYLLDYRAARRAASEQIRITAPDVVAAAESAALEFHANVFNAFPNAFVEWRVGTGGWSAMQKTEHETDPLFQQLFDEEQPLLDKLPWRKLAKPLVCPHLWKASLRDPLLPGAYLIQVQAKNPNGQILTGERLVRVE